MKYLKLSLSLFALVFSINLQAQESEEHSAEDLSKKLANPIASLISVPFQNNLDYGIGDFKGSRYTLNIQPVIPMSISNNWNLISRIIIPVVSQYNITAFGANESGLSDVVASVFFVPKNSKNGWILGIGPVVLLPTGSNSYLSSKKWGAGPTAVVLKQKNGLTYGTLINQVWSFAGDENRSNVSQMYINPFLTYNWKSGAGITAQFEWTENWVQNSTTLYFEPVVSALTSFGKQKVSLAIGPRLNMLAPDNSESKFGLRASLVLLFPN